MTCHRFRSGSAISISSLAVALLIAAHPVQAGQGSQAPAKAAPQTVQSAPLQPDAAQTRAELTKLLETYPPAVRNVLRLDPSLLSNQAYLAPYPTLAAYIASHPEIARDPRYYLGGGYTYYQPDPKTEATRMWGRMLTFVGFFLVFAVVTGAVAWIIGSFIDYRRWHQQSRMQIDLHNKLVDRFSGNEELIAYVQSPAGRRLFENASAGLNLTAGDVGLPVRRVMWAIQAGLVLVAGGAGIVFVSGSTIEEMQQPLYAIGAVILFLGAGFLLSAFASYVLSQRLGLLEGLKRSDDRGRPAAPGV